MATQYASSNQRRLSYVKEVTFGVEPTGTQKQELRYTGSSLGHTITKGTPAEVRSDGMVPALTQKSAETAGGLDMNWSYGSYDEFLVAAMRSTGWSTALNFNGTIVVAITNAGTADETATLTASGIGTNVVVGQWIRLSASTTASNDGFYLVTAVTAGELTIANPNGATDALTADAGDTGMTITGSMLRNGVNLDSFTIQEDMLDASRPSSFIHTGMRVGGMSLNASVGGDLSGSFNLMGLDTTYADYADTTALTAAMAGGAPSSPTTTSVMSAVGDVKNIQINGAPSGDTCFNSVTLEVNSNLRGQDCIGKLGHNGVAIGTFNVTGSINLYFKDTAQFKLFKDNTAFSVSFRSEDDAGNAYVWTIPTLQYSSLTIDGSGLDTDIMDNTNISASIDATTACMLQVDKFSA